MKTSLVSVVATLALSAAPTAMAQNQPPPEQQVIRPADGSMTCVQVADEAARLSADMGGSPGGSVFGTLTGVAQAGASMLIPGAGLAIAGANALTQGGRDREEADKRAVEQRWYYLNGLYTGLRCQTDTPPPAAPAPAQPPAVQPPQAQPPR